MMDNVYCIKTFSDYEALLKIPFDKKKILFSINSDFFQDGNNLLKLKEKELSIDIDDEKLLHNTLSEFPCGNAGCPAMFSNVHDYEIHYNTNHKIVCIECKRSFPSYNLLDAHITENHDSFHKVASEKNVAYFECFVEGCCDKFPTVDQRNKHVIKLHQYPADFKYQSLKQPKKEVEKMDVTESEETSIAASSSSTIKNNKKPVPYYVCFGRGSQKAFSTKRNKAKQSRDISMKELEDAL